MSVTTIARPSVRPAFSSMSIVPVLVRWFLGALLVYLGLTKALQPVEFLKLVREYQLFDSPLILNAVSSIVPWLEVFCGILLLTGIAVRGTAFVILILLGSFTAAVLARALGVSELNGIALCAVRFDCGCGSGEVLACRKIMENALLMAASGYLVFSRVSRLCLRHSVWEPRSQPSLGNPQV